MFFGGHTALEIGNLEFRKNAAPLRARPVTANIVQFEKPRCQPRKLIGETPGDVEAVVAFRLT